MYRAFNKDEGNVEDIGKETREIVAVGLQVKAPTKIAITVSESCVATKIAAIVAMWMLGDVAEAINKAQQVGSTKCQVRGPNEITMSAGDTKNCELPEILTEDKKRSGTGTKTLTEISKRLGSHMHDKR